MAAAKTSAICTMIIVLVAAVFVYMFVVRNSENFEEATEFRGINMMGVNSNDTFVPAQSVQECADICERNRENGCKGFSYYWPGNRCYVYESGGMVPDRVGFTSGFIDNTQ